MKIIVPLLLFFLIGHATSGEITEQYWFDGEVERMGNEARFAKLRVTYQQTIDPNKRINCVVSDKNGKTIAGASKSSNNYVARLSFKLKDKYRYQQVEVQCD
ncbi:hypothetical protein N8Z26_06955 [Burkholderiales bacterium]|nr:hypothetical protein [Burkholderiales bacterium]